VDLDSKLPRGTSPPLSIEIVLEKNEYHYHGIKVIFLFELDEGDILQALKALPTVIKKALLVEQEFLEEAGENFLGFSVRSYVYLPDRAEWMNIDDALDLRRKEQISNSKP
jgi:hypothetical protein